MVSVRSLRDHLDRAEMTYYCDEAEGVLVIPFANAQVLVRVLEDGEGVAIYVPALLSFDEAAEHREALLSVMARLNYRRKIGALGFDEDSGEIHVVHFVAVEDGALTAAQFLRAVHGVVSSARHCGPLLRHVAYQGDGSLPLETLLEQVNGSLRRHRLLLAAEMDPRLAEPPEALRAMFEELAREAEQTPPGPATGNAESEHEGDDHE